MDQIIQCPRCDAILARVAAKKDFVYFDVVLYTFKLRVSDTVNGRVVEIICDCGCYVELKRANLERQTEIKSA